MPSIIRLASTGPEVTGAIITGIERFIEDIANEPPNIRFEVHNGRFKIVHLFRAIRKMSKTNSTEKTREIVVLVCKTLEEAAENRDLEADLGTLSTFG